MFLIFLLTCLFLSRLLIKYEIDIHVCYNLQNNFFYQNYRSVLFMVNNFTKNKLEKEIQYPILELQNISVEEIDGCQFDSIVISETKNVNITNFSRFIRLPFPFCILRICQSVADISITRQFHEFQNISMKESDGCRHLKRVQKLKSSPPVYSHLSYKRGAHAYRIEKFHPPQKKSTLHIY